MIPEDFNGFFKIPLSTTFKIYDKIKKSDDEPFVIHFYRRENESRTIGEFIDSITPENIGWDSPTRQLFYKDKKGITYQINFDKLK